MKKNRSKVVLQRETLLQLEKPVLEDVAAGIPTTVASGCCSFVYTGCKC